jgi:RHS repeat-associated protein
MATLVGQFAAAGTSLSGSQAFDPWGTITATTGALTGNLGYQSGWTDAVTGKVSMGARWYSPGTGDFTSRDTATVSPVPDSADASPFAYAGDSPLGAVDLTGHRPTAPQGTMPASPPRPAPAPKPATTSGSSCTSWCFVPSPLRGLVHAVASKVDDGRELLNKWGDEGLAAAQSEMRELHRTVSYAAQVVEKVAKAGAGEVRSKLHDLSTAVSDAR